MLAILVKAWDEINEKDVDEEVKMICYGFDTLSNKNGMQVGKSVMLGCTTLHFISMNCCIWGVAVAGSPRETRLVLHGENVQNLQKFREL